MAKNLRIAFTYNRSLTIPYEMVSKKQLYIILQQLVDKEIVGVSKVDD